MVIPFLISRHAAGVLCGFVCFVRFGIDPGRDERHASRRMTSVRSGVDELGRRYFRSAATLSMPALAQASSLSPPGAPETPTAPIVSSPTLIGSAPCAATMLLRRSAPAVKLPLTPSANSPDGRRMVRAV